MSIETLEQLNKAIIKAAEIILVCGKELETIIAKEGRVNAIAVMRKSQLTLNGTTYRWDIRNDNSLVLKKYCKNGYLQEEFPASVWEKLKKMLAEEYLPLYPRGFVTLKREWDDSNEQCVFILLNLKALKERIIIHPEKSGMCFSAMQGDCPPEIFMDWLKDEGLLEDK